MPPASQAQQAQAQSSATAPQYDTQPGMRDELRDANGWVRPAWRKFVDHWGRLGPTELASRWETAQQLLHDNGVSYNVYGDPRGMERPWSLSLPPVVIGQEEWQKVAEGLSQRARLLAALLQDLYGQQRSLLEGTLPPAVLYLHPSFLRTLHGAKPPRGLWLPIYGADFVRGQDGMLRVTDDLTQAPSGAGYALENRIAVSKALPELFRECNVQRLALFFRGFRDMLGSLAPHNRDNPRIVLLTAGPYNATYFEQAYLAQYLGITLVAGGDLTVREDRVFLKTLAGLLPVDVILRRVNDDYCDPLELRPDSILGVPGLVQAVRAGNVAIASPLGAGVAQAPALLPYLPRLCRMLLDEELLMPSVETRWCGDPSALRDIESHFDDLLIRPAFPEGRVVSTATALLSSQEKADLLARIRHTPERFVAQERVQATTTPVLIDGKLTPRAVMWRAYAIAGQDGEPNVMPGGLARVAGDEAGMQMSMQTGAGSLDVWVLSDEPVTAFSLLPPQHSPVAISRGGADLPSRAADNLYWLGRYAERAEVIARLSRVVSARLAELGSDADVLKSTEIGPLISALNAQTNFLYAADIPRADVRSLAASEQALTASVFDANAAGSLASVVRATLRSGRVVRDRISMDTWRVIASLDEELSDLSVSTGSDRLASVHDLLSRVVITLAAFSGLVMESMTRGQAWLFLDIGRRIERAIGLVTLLRSTITLPCDRESALLEAVLEIADSVMTYRRRYLATLQVAPVVDLLLTDETNPRSVVYQLIGLTEHVRRLPMLDGMPVRSAEHRIALGARSELELCEIERICVPDTMGRRPALETLLRRLGTQLPKLSDSLSESYLAHARLSRHLSMSSPFDSEAPPSSDGEDP